MIDTALRVLGRHSLTVVDVGARWGASDSWWRLPELARYVGFEPDPEECERLDALVGPDEKARFIPIALGRTKTTQTLNITKDPACSSVYAPIQKLADRYPDLECIRETETTMIDLFALDAWADADEIGDVKFIKLDTQGSELDILEGATKLLQGCCGLEIEVEFSPIYAGQPLFADVDVFLRSQGFVLWRLSEQCHYAESAIRDDSSSGSVHYTGLDTSTESGSGRLLWANAIYLRDFYEIEKSRERARERLILATLLHSLGDVAGAKACLELVLSEDADQLQTGDEDVLRAQLLSLQPVRRAVEPRRRWWQRTPADHRQ